MHTPIPSRVVSRFLLASSVKIEFLTAEEMDARLRDKYRDRVKTNVPYVDEDDTDWRMRDQSMRGSYFVASINDQIVGVRKFYHWPDMKRDVNQFLQAQGIPLVEGRVFNGAYVAVHPEFRRQGVATRLNEAVMAHLQPGDVMVLGSHEPDGKALNREWLSRVKGQVNIMYGGRLTSYIDYDPSRVNYVVSDDSLGRLAMRSF